QRYRGRCSGTRSARLDLLPHPPREWRDGQVERREVSRAPRPVSVPEGQSTQAEQRHHGIGGQRGERGTLPPHEWRSQERHADERGAIPEEALAGADGESRDRLPVLRREPWDEHVRHRPEIDWASAPSEVVTEAQVVVVQRERETRDAAEHELS